MTRVRLGTEKASVRLLEVVLERVLAAVSAPTECARKRLLHGVVQLDVALQIALVVEAAAAQAARVDGVAPVVGCHLKGVFQQNRVQFGRCVRWEGRNK